MRFDKLEGKDQWSVGPEGGGRFNLTENAGIADDRKIARFFLALFAAAISYGQGFDGLERAVQEQLNRNVKATTVSPGETARIQFSLKPNALGSATVMVGTEDPNFGITLRLSTGIVIDRNTAAGSGFGWEAIAGRSLRLRACGSVTDWISISVPGSAPAGDYTIEFSSSLGAQRTNACATYLSFAPFQNYEVVGNSVKMDRQLYQLGDPVTISIPVRDGNQPVREAQVEAVVSYQQNIVVGGEAARLTLRDASGTGMYSGVFTPPKPSQYNVTVTISGRTQRETGGFFVVPLHARLLSATLSFPDTHPQARIRFQIFSAGQYRVAPTIRGGNGKIDNAAVSVDLTPGEHVVTWEPNAQEPQVLDMAPPYELVEVHVTKNNPAADFGADLVGTWTYNEGRWTPK